MGVEKLPLESPPTKSSIFKNTKFIFGIALGAIVISVVSAIVIVVFSVKETKKNVHYHWDYLSQDEWAGLCESGTLQSPIALEEDSAEELEIPALNFLNVDYYDEVEVENDGHSVVVKLDVCNCSKPRLSGGGLVGNYTLDHFHFHWPSEHIIDGDQYELEGHFVFYSEQYDSLEIALRFPYGVAVVGVLFDEEKTRTHNNFVVLDEAVEKVSTKAYTSTTTTKGITISDFFPKELNQFFRYDGSLTTPDCVEKINWIVLKEPSIISKSDLRRLTRIYTPENELLTSNNRILQKRNTRKIYVREGSR